MAEPASLIAPTLEAARTRIAAIRPADYARTRNWLDGAVTGLSPYITHGLVSSAQVLADVALRDPLGVQHRFVFELGWRAYFRHVWQQQGAGILTSLHSGPLPDQAYSPTLPVDIREGNTGVPVVDQAVRLLYRTGLLHNHARMWLASYVVHLRKVHWRVGADWLYSHLLDGDLASNHLSWQWIAGTASRQPYLFNADNVARFAPSPWHSPGTVIDTSYDELARIATEPIPPELSRRGSTAVAAAAVEPVVTDRPVDDPALHMLDDQAQDTIAREADAIAGEDVWLVHPWSLGELPADCPTDALIVGIYVADFHRQWPWSEHRWRFVNSRMTELASRRWYGPASSIGKVLGRARRVHSTDEPHLAPWLGGLADCDPAASLFPPVEQRCDSFSQWWKRATHGLHDVRDLLAAQR